MIFKMEFREHWNERKLSKKTSWECVFDPLFKGIDEETEWETRNLIKPIASTEGWATNFIRFHFMDKTNLEKWRVSAFINNLINPTLLTLSFQITNAKFSNNDWFRRKLKLIYIHLLLSKSQPRVCVYVRGRGGIRN